MRFIGLALAMIMVSSLGACVSKETDPRKGGLFSYNPKAYEKRLEDRKATLADTEADTEQARQEGAVLETEKKGKIQKQQVLKNRLAGIYAETGALEKQLDQVKAANAAQKKELKRLKDETVALRASTIQVNNSGGSDQEKKAEIARLQQQMDELLKEAEALSAL
jgi:predicted RNase H-like nuclease (RuvC/YqgF family)